MHKDANARPGQGVVKDFQSTKTAMEHKLNQQAGRARKLPFLECKQASLLTLLVAYVGGKEGGKNKLDYTKVKVKRHSGSD